MISLINCVLSLWWHKVSTFNTVDFTAKMSLDLLKLHLTFVRMYCNIESTGFSGGSDGKESACNVGDLISIPGLGRSPGERLATHTSGFLPGESP